MDLVLKNWGDLLVSVLAYCNCPSFAFNAILVLSFTVTNGLAEWPWPLNPAPLRWQLSDNGRESEENLSDSKKEEREEERNFSNLER
jgi:hypothetical protein